MDELLDAIDGLTFQQRLFFMSVIAGRLSDEDMERTLKALETIKAQLQRLVTAQ